MVDVGVVHSLICELVRWARAMSRVGAGTCSDPPRPVPCCWAKKMGAVVVLKVQAALTPARNKGR